MQHNEDMSIDEDPDNQELEVGDQEEFIEIPDIELDLEDGELATLDEEELDEIPDINTLI